MAAIIITNSQVELNCTVSALIIKCLPWMAWKLIKSFKKSGGTLVIDSAATGVAKRGLSFISKAYEGGESQRSVQTEAHHQSRPQQSTWSVFKTIGNILFPLWTLY